MDQLVIWSAAWLSAVTFMESQRFSCENRWKPTHSPHIFRPTWPAKEYAARGAYAYVSMIQREERKNKVSRAVPVRKGDQCGNIIELGKFAVEVIVITILKWIEYAIF